MTQLTEELRSLGSAQAPRTLKLRVLQETTGGDRYAAMSTPLGNAFVAFSRNGISAVRRMDDPGAFERWFEDEHGRPARRVDALPERLRRRPAYDLRGLSSFEQAVLRKALEIPPGEVRTYSWIASEISKPKAVRAVGSALGRNPIPVLIPCHRVVRTDGTIGEYGLGGPEAKRIMLAAEGAEPDELERLARRGVRYVGSDTNNVFCFPTCRHARRIAEAHRVGFRSEGEALAAGYRACQACRPALAS